MKQQAMNPFLPMDEYIPDGEPHVFGDRIYLYGSHDIEGAHRYCAGGNYLCYSAPLTDLSDWKCEGEIYNAKWGPYWDENQYNDLYAPDVVQGNDGRYYLYFNVNGMGPTCGHNMIQVAVCDTPAGKYEYLGFVQNEDGTPFCQYLDGDPAAMNDEGIIRLYFGWSFSMVAAAAHAQGKPTEQQKQDSTVRVYGADEKKQETKRQQSSRMPEPGSPEMKYALKPIYKMIFNREGEAVEHLEYPLMGANTVELCDDMLTVKSKLKRIVPGQFDTPKDSSFYGHAFYEAASIRKIKGMYYFIYSSENSNELCYATSQYPDCDFIYGGTIISNGDVGYHGRKPEDRLNMTANNHGSLESVNGQWYIFYHRQTHNSTFSRQACAEPVKIREDGSIAQVECTSCGLNGGPLKAQGTYPAIYACNITNGHMPHATNTMVNADIPYITHDSQARFITNIQDGDMIGFKYFQLTGEATLAVETRGDAKGKFVVALDEACTEQVVGEIEIEASQEWKTFQTCISAQQVAPIYLKYAGSGCIDLLDIEFH